MEHKSRVLGRARSDFRLLETMAWTPDGGVALRSRHVDRMAASADHFGFEFDAAAVDALLDGVDADGPRRLRLLGAPDGGVELQVTEAPEPTTGAWDVPIDLEPVTSGHEFLFHKTTLREVYDDARARFPEAPDVLLWNEVGELTETTIGNLVVRLDGRLVTPPVSCGLLPGTFRAQLLADGEVVEQVVRRGDLDRADGVWMVNSVRGWVPISLVYAGSRR